MTLDQVLTLLQAGYTKEEISQLGKGPEASETDKPVEIDVEEKKPEQKTEPDKPEQPSVQIDYAKMSKELLKAMAGQDNGTWTPPKTKEEKTEEALLSLLK